MRLHPQLRLSTLRKIGWSLWDPIGLAREGQAPDENCADEYDAYLLHVVSLLAGGRSVNEATRFLIGIATDHMGLSVVDTAPAKATAHAIADLIASVPDEPKTAR